MVYIKRDTMKMKRKKKLLRAGFVSSYLVVYFRHHFLFFGKSNFEGWLFSNQEHCTTHAIVIVESIHGVLSRRSLRFRVKQATVSLWLMEGFLNVLLTSSLIKISLNPTF
jgi:hypothetical protein